MDIGDRASVALSAFDPRCLPTPPSGRRPCGRVRKTRCHCLPGHWPLLGHLLGHLLGPPWIRLACLRPWAKSGGRYYWARGGRPIETTTSQCFQRDAAPWPPYPHAQRRRLAHVGARTPCVPWEKGRASGRGGGFDLEIGDADGCIKETESSSYYIWQNFTVSNSSDSKKGGTKNAVLKFCDKKWLLYFEGSSPHFGAFCIRPRKSWNTGMYHHQQK